MSAPRILLVGAGGIGAPAAIALAGAGPLVLRVVDDDVVERTNLHRQILFTETDVGRSKLDAFETALARRAARPAGSRGAGSVTMERVVGRFRPDTASALLRDVAVAIDASDNFPTRFLVADACALAGVPVVHAAAVRWQATVLAVGRVGAPCYRCLFEDLPDGPAPDCATAGVAGPVCGVAGAIAADRALRLLAGDRGATGAVVTYDGWRDVLREVVVSPRRACPLCGAARSIEDLDPGRYGARGSSDPAGPAPRTSVPRDDRHSPSRHESSP